ncbi:hypothetical protein HJC23_005111 [Cyclotella cryptica]|uniref:Uncharacterized protein n=1 Tax=Cyclotella cryptica TaxID=29204 RepID=A0ABD3QF41_9STRA|eukprot:CCRYP_005795-RA/>CCRYP_005795-RA protein AED:0.39 eAED:0.39 QI:263/1/1/1/1/1/2/245/222
MEVVSPLTFSRSDQPPAVGSTKRRFACSPMHNDANGVDSMMADDFSDCMMDDSCGFQATKRRRKMNGEEVGPSWGVASPFAAAGRAPGSACGNPKRSRSRSPPHSPHAKLLELQQTISLQASELCRLKSEHDSALATVSTLTSQNSKLDNENKILKRAVTIQQERQNQMQSELEQARRVNGEAGERIRRLEQMNLTLQYQLQAVGNVGNDFMRFSPHPPDVY